MDLLIVYGVAEFKMSFFRGTKTVARYINDLGDLICENLKKIIFLVLKFKCSFKLNLVSEQIIEDQGKPLSILAQPFAAE